MIKLSIRRKATKFLLVTSFLIVSVIASSQVAFANTTITGEVTKAEDTSIDAKSKEAIAKVEDAEKYKTGFFIDRATEAVNGLSDPALKASLVERVNKVKATNEAKKAMITAKVDATIKKVETDIGTKVATAKKVIEAKKPELKQKADAAKKAAAIKIAQAKQAIEAKKPELQLKAEAAKKAAATEIAMAKKAMEAKNAEITTGIADIQKTMKDNFLDKASKAVSEVANKKNLYEENVKDVRIAITEIGAKKDLYEENAKKAIGQISNIKTTLQALLP
ncbi:MAG: hypothetical protein RR582_05670 [Niameybacter sp.]